MDVQSLVNILQNLGASPYIAPRTAGVDTARAAMQIAEAGGLRFADVVARGARDAAQCVVGNAARSDVLIVDRADASVGESD